MEHESLTPRHFSYDFLNEITDGFSEKNLLGIGGYGKVYKGVHKDGKRIAVKKLHDMLELDDNKFEKEFNNLTTLRHHNIVRLVGYCRETQQECVQYNGNLVTAYRIYRALCFDYMPNKSLDKHLFDEYNGHDWHTRFGMIKGIWDGLKYLHEDLNPPMYHLDLKPANILLDENMVVKIADFGLSRLFGEELTRITQNSFIGTRGYLPPEYIEKGVLSKMFDIFSLGVVTIKIMTGPDGYKRSVDMSPKEFIELVHANWRNRLQATDTPVCVVESYSEQVRICIKTALRCVDKDRHKRPIIGDIINDLNKTEIMIQKLSQFLGSLSNDDPVSSVDQAECVIQKWPDVNHQDFLDALDRLRNIEHFFSSNRSYSCSYEVLSRVNALLLKALVKMESEFKNLLSQSRKPVERDHLFDCLPSRFRSSLDQFPPKGEKKPSTSAQSKNREHPVADLYLPLSLTEPTLGDFKNQLFQSRFQALSYLSQPKLEKQASAGGQSANQESPEADVYIPPSLIDPTFIPLLAKLAEQLVQAGYQQECAKIYGEARASALESSLKNLGVEKLSKTQVQDSNIRDWIHVMRISVKLLFAGERLLCNQVFEWNQSLADKCFAAITENSLAMLQSFGEAMAMGERSPFLLLDMYEIICELQAEAELLNRSRGLAKGVVVMICPVLLALALNIVDLNGKAYGHRVPIAMITMAGFTLITGICPLLVCCFSEGFPGWGVGLAPITTILATLSSCSLVVLACLIAQSVVSKSIFITIGVICGILVLVRTVCYYVYDTQNNDGWEYTMDMHNVLDESHEFLIGVTGILFLGFEGLALDGHGQTGYKSRELMGYISFIVCTFGVCLMFLEMTPPQWFAVHKHGTYEERIDGEQQIVCLTLILDCIMAVGIFVLLLVVMLMLTPLEVALWVLVPPAVSFGQLLILVVLRGNTEVEQEFRPASLKLTKVTFTGFLAVSITTISTASSSKLTGLFLLLSSMAIEFGLSWRLLSQANIRKGLSSCVSSAHVSSAAKVASFCTHLCIVIAAILFVVMARNASGK